MALSIKDAETDRLAREVSELTGESITVAIKTALKERLGTLRRKRKQGTLADELDRIALEIAALPVLDDRTAEAIIGYDEWGLPS